MSLRLDFCSYEAATYAVKRWHYSRTMPKGRLTMFGVWENDQFIGAVVFGSGAGNAADGRRFGLPQSFHVAELVRIALRRHSSPVTRIVSIALRMLRRHAPGLRVLISFADPRQGHVGAIYQAGNWLYFGETTGCKLYVDRNGVEHHKRTVSKTGIKTHFGRPAPCMKPSDAVRVIRQPGKHIYVLPLDDEMRAQLTPKSLPYPRRQHGDHAASVQDAEGGSTPTPALH